MPLRSVDSGPDGEVDIRQGCPLLGSEQTTSVDDLVPTRIAALHPIPRLEQPVHQRTDDRISAAGWGRVPASRTFKPTRDRYAERRAGLQHRTEPVWFQRIRRRQPRLSAAWRPPMASPTAGVCRCASRKHARTVPPIPRCAFVERGCGTAEKAAHRVRQHLRKTPASRLHDAVLQDRRKIQSVTRTGQCDVEESPGLVLFALALRFVTLGYERTNGNGRRLHPHRRR